MSSALRALQDILSFIKGRRALSKEIGNKDMEYAYRDVQFLVKQHLDVVEKEEQKKERHSDEKRR